MHDLATLEKMITMRIKDGTAGTGGITKERGEHRESEFTLKKEGIVIRWEAVGWAGARKTV